MRNERPNNKKRLLIIGLVIAILVLAVVIVGVLCYMNIINISFGKAEYTKGKIVGNEYQNKWAKLKLHTKSKKSVVYTVV